MRADLGRLRQVLFNLIGNAVKFTENGTIHVRAFTNDHGQHLAVADDGRGIALDRQTAIFEPFVQADDETNMLFGGTGLGLAITRRLCRLMGGDVVLQSEVGRGSTFTVTLPLD